MLVVPSAWVSVVLALGVYRLVRLVGWDDFPPVHRLRARVIGETAHWNPAESRDTAIYRYKRPTLQHFLNCAFCQGFWFSTIAYLGWRFEPTWTLYALAPLALSGAVGLIAKNLDG